MNDFKGIILNIQWTIRGEQTVELYFDRIKDWIVDASDYINLTENTKVEPYIVRRPRAWNYIISCYSDTVKAFRRIIACVDSKHHLTPLVFYVQEEIDKMEEFNFAHTWCESNKWPTFLLEGVCGKRHSTRFGLFILISHSFDEWCLRFVHDLLDSLEIRRT